VRGLALALVAVAVAAGLAAQSASSDWRAAQLESFDVVWQTINATYYDPEFGGLDWTAVRDEMRPRVEAAASEEAARDVTRRMLARLGRSHVGLLSKASAPPPSGGPATVPFDVRVTDEGVLITRVDADREAAGRERVRPGDVLVAIDDEPVSVHLAAAEGADARATAFDAWRRIDAALRGPVGSRVRIAVRRVGAAVEDIPVLRRLGAGELVRFGNLPAFRVAVDRQESRTPGGGRVGVIAFNVWLAAITEPVAEAVDAFRQHDGLVFDLRGNPGGLADMIRGMAGHVIDTPVVLGRMRLRTARLEFPVNPRRVTPDGRAVLPYAGPVAILVDALTGSTSECFAGALQSLGRARVFGRPTLGQALPALTKQLPSGDVLVYAIGDFETSTGQALEGEGVTPDEVVPLSAGRLAEGGDPDLEAALRWFDRF
jgi:carboxyl-terminal processing protease